MILLIAIIILHMLSAELYETIRLCLRYTLRVSVSGASPSVKLVVGNCKHSVKSVLIRKRWVICKFMNLPPHIYVHVHTHTHTQLWRRSGAWLNNMMPFISLTDDELLKVQEKQVSDLVGLTSLVRAYHYSYM